MSKTEFQKLSCIKVQRDRKVLLLSSVFFFLQHLEIGMMSVKRIWFFWKSSLEFDYFKTLILKWLSKNGKHFLIIVLLSYLALFSFPSWKILPVYCGIFFNVVVWLRRVIDFTSVISNMFLWLDGYKVQVAHKVLSGVWIYLTCWFISQGWFAAMINSITKKILGIFYFLISQNST